MSFYRSGGKNNLRMCVDQRAFKKVFLSTEYCRTCWIVGMFLGLKEERNGVDVWDWSHRLERGKEKICSICVTGMKVCVHLLMLRECVVLRIKAYHNGENKGIVTLPCVHLSWLSWLGRILICWWLCFGRTFVNTGKGIKSRWETTCK